MPLPYHTRAKAAHAKIPIATHGRSKGRRAALQGKNARIFGPRVPAG